MSTESMFEEMILGAWETAAAHVGEEQLRHALEGDALTEASARTIPGVAEALVDSLVQAAPDMIAERAGPEAVTREQVRRVFGPGLDICEISQRRSSSGARTIASDHALHAGPPSGEDMPNRGGNAQLLKNVRGLGAYARWRAMQVNVFASFIAHHGDETARRFVEHHPVQRWRTLAGERARLEAIGGDVPRHLLSDLASLRRPDPRRAGH